MIIEVTDITYKGFRVLHVKDKGWKIVLVDVEYLFPNLQAAQSAIDEFFGDVVPKNGGKKIKA